MGARRGRYDTDAGIDGRICRSEVGSPWNDNREGNREDVEDGRRSTQDLSSLKNLRCYLSSCELFEFVGTRKGFGGK